MKARGIKKISTNYTTIGEGEDLENLLNPIMIFGKIIGLLPIIRGEVKLNENANANAFSSFMESPKIISIIGPTKEKRDWKKWILRRVHGLATIAVGINACGSVYEFCEKNVGSNKSAVAEKTLIEIASDGQDLFFILSGIFTYSYFLYYGACLVNIFQLWKRTLGALRLPLISEDNDNSGGAIKNNSTNTNTKWMMRILMMSMMIEFILYFLKHVSILPSHIDEHDQNDFDVTNPVMENREFRNDVEQILWRVHQFRTRSIPFNPFYMAIIIITNTLSYFAWNITDLFLIAFTRAIGAKFRELTKTSEKSITPSSDLKIPHPISWTQIRRDHFLLSCLTKEIESFFSPLLFISFSINAYSICVQIHEVLLPIGPKNGIEKAYAVYFLFHLILRIGLVTQGGAMLHDWAHKIGETMQKCDSRDYSPEMERLERYLRTHPIAFTGLSCFVVTRSFVLVIFSILFTIEIILLQGGPALAGNDNPNNSTRIR